LDFPWCGVLFLLDYIFTLDFPWCGVLFLLDYIFTLDFPWCGVLFLLDYIFTLDFPWLDLSRDYLLRTVRLPLQLGQSTHDIQRNAVPSLLVPSLPYMSVHVMAEGAVVSRGPAPMRPKLVRSFRGKSGGGEWDVDDKFTSRRL
jgi:hypothetical protein